MQAINAKVTWRGEPVLLVDRLPPWEGLRFRKLRDDDPRDPGHLYVAEQDGDVACLFQHDPGHPGTARGSPAEPSSCTWTTRPKEKLVGPFSASTDMVNQYLPGLTARQVLLTDDPRRFENDMVATVGAITARLWEELGDRFPAVVADHDTNLQRRGHGMIDQLDLPPRTQPSADGDLDLGGHYIDRPVPEHQHRRRLRRDGAAWSQDGPGCRDLTTGTSQQGPPGRLASVAGSDRLTEDRRRPCGR